MIETEHLLINFQLVGFWQTIVGGLNRFLSIGNFLISANQNCGERTVESRSIQSFRQKESRLPTPKILCAARCLRNHPFRKLWCRENYFHFRSCAKNNWLGRTIA